LFCGTLWFCFSDGERLLVLIDNPADMDKVG